MKKAAIKSRKSIDFSQGVRGKYSRMKLVIAGAESNDTRVSAKKKTDAETVLRKVSRVLESAGSSTRELESAIDRARDLIQSAGRA